MQNQQYTVEAVNDENGTLSDIRIHINGKVWHMWGRKGAERELGLADSVPDGSLPVMIGSGLGCCLDKLAERGPVAVVDREKQLGQATGARRFSQHPNVLWLDCNDPETIIKSLYRWQQEQGSISFEPVRIPVYMRLDRNYYGAVAAALEEAGKADFWAQVKYPKFQNTSPRILFLNRQYFLVNEIKEALARKGVEYSCVDVGEGDTVREGFVEELLRTVMDFKPDFALTVNHFGVDREGKFTDLLSKIDLPLASWFVDNPYLILYRYDKVRPEKTAVFTYDAGNLDIMREQGFNNVFYLPLATDPDRFKSGTTGKPEWEADVSFVGNSMVKPVAQYLEEANLPDVLSRGYRALSAEFGEAEDLSVSRFLKRRHPDRISAMEKLPSDEQKLSYEALITWEATRQYRLDCVKRLMKYNPLIAGDDGWKELLGHTGWRYLAYLDYYNDLPGFYPMSKVNFNCTSRQMKGAVNQRIFDVPACGGFVLTDHREQMEKLFDPEVEVVSYGHPDEIGDLVDKYLKDSSLRDKVSAAARKRILAEHTYEHRITDLIEKMRQTFGGI